MKVKVDKQKCEGCATCTVLCPKYFELDKDGKAVVKKEQVDPKDEESVVEAKDSCPADAIKIED